MGPLQQGILFHRWLSSPEQGDTYIMPSIFSVAASAEAKGFVRALNRVVLRHDVLRTAIFWHGLAEAVPIVLRTPPIQPRHFELSADQPVAQQLSARTTVDGVGSSAAVAPGNGRKTRSQSAISWSFMNTILLTTLWAWNC